jgi:hypothetical protein
MDYWHEGSNDRALSHVIVWASVPAIGLDMRPGAAVVLVAIRDSSIPGAVAFCYDLLRVEGVWLVALAGNSASIREIAAKTIGASHGINLAELNGVTAMSEDR